MHFIQFLIVSEMVAADDCVSFGLDWRALLLLGYGIGMLLCCGMLSNCCDWATGENRLSRQLLVSDRT